MLRHVHAEREYKELIMDILRQGREIMEMEREKLYEKKKKESHHEEESKAAASRTMISRYKATKGGPPARKKKNVQRHFAKPAEGKKSANTPADQPSGK